MGSSSNLHIACDAHRQPDANPNWRDRHISQPLSPNHHIFRYLHFAPVGGDILEHLFGRVPVHRIGEGLHRKALQPASSGLYSHLWGSRAKESASLSARRSSEILGNAAAGAPYAPSTWNHTYCRRHTAAMSRKGSPAPPPTVPA